MGIVSNHIYFRANISATCFLIAVRLTTAAVFDRFAALAVDADMQNKWRYFLKTIKRQELPFSDVICDVDVFLRPVWNAIVNEDEFIGEWSASATVWMTEYLIRDK